MPIPITWIQANSGIPAEREADPRGQEAELPAKTILAMEEKQQHRLVFCTLKNEKGVEFERSALSKGMSLRQARMLAGSPDHRRRVLLRGREEGGS